MWNQWKKQRHIATAQSTDTRCRALRRLSFEAMEGRLMLSGDAPEFVSWGAYSPEFRLAIYPLASAPQQTAPVEIVEGGFIQPGAVLLGSSAHGTLDTVTNRANVGEIQPRTLTTISYNLSDWPGVTFNFDGVHLDTPSIPVIQFPATDSDAGTTFVDQVDIVGPAPTEVTADEGGAIPINSILAFVGQTDSWRSGERLASKATLQSREPNWGRPSVSNSAQAREIVGEWARPTMLVMAGGEPARISQPEKLQHEQTPVPDGDDNMLIRRRLSSGAAADTPTNDSRTASDFDRTSSATDQSNDAAHASRRWSSSSDRLVSFDLTSHMVDADSLIRESTESAETKSIENGSASDGNALKKSAYAEVYDELGNNDAVGAQDVFNRDTWRDSWKATPLLVILALERIAASNSRRAKREASSNAGQHSRL
jgi:hypothetical protein